jgi:nucleoid-associated protein YgaU
MGPYAVASPPGGAPTPAAPVNETPTAPDAVAPPVSTAAPDKEAVDVGAVRKAPRRRGVAKHKVAEREVVREAAQADPPQVAAPDGPSDAWRGLEVVRASPATAVSASAEVGDVSGRVHVVRAGESLWSIAKQVLGGAQVSTARVAREVNRLWELNQDRIGTGNPDLLMVDTKLRLR